jgi:pimeloyl-ACP methyl ester carboxylesterase
MTSAPIWSTTAGDPGAPHVVLIHGSLDRSAGMLKLSRRLDESFRVTRYDRRGYGRSLPCGGPYGMRDQVADLVDLLRSGGERPPSVLFGHSYGGNVALAAAQRHPELVAGVMVYESPLPWVPWWPDSTAGADAAAWSDAPSEAAERFMRRLLGDERWERLPPATREARRAEGPALVAELADLRQHVPWTADKIATPVVAMRGEHGQQHHRLAMDAMRDWFGCEIVVVPGARHFGPNTHPDEVGSVVAGFASTAFSRAPDA